MFTSGSPLVKQSMQGPWEDCSSNSSSTLASSDDAATTSRLALLVGEHQAGGVGGQQFDAALDQGVQEVDDVEADDQRVGQFHEDPGDAFLSGHHCPPSRLWTLWPSRPGHALSDSSRDRTAVPATQDVPGDRQHRPVRGVCAGPQQQQRVHQRDPGLRGDHPGCLVDLGPVGGEPGELRMQPAGRIGQRLQVQQHRGRGVGVGQRLGQDAVEQAARGVPVQVEHPEPDPADLQRKGEHRVQRRRPARPARTSAIGRSPTRRSERSTGPSCRSASTPGPSPSSNCSSSTVAASPSVAATTRSRPAVLCRTIAAPVIGSSLRTMRHNAAGSDSDVGRRSVISFARISWARPGEVTADPRRCGRRAIATAGRGIEPPAGTCR